MLLHNNPVYLFKTTDPYFKNIMSDTPKYGLPPFQAATELPTLPTLEEFSSLGSKNNRDCPPLSALSIHQQAFLPPMARTHANALAIEVMQNRMAQTSPFESFSC